ncbi:MAG TPA: sarcosine oxidase subunit alpha family protein [Stellaceae bacterium]|nr:sarcosine oxidase subunit alpha family protein [Stellaceae bacterium]
MTADTVGGTAVAFDRPARTPASGAAVQPYRVASGGLIDRSTDLAFSFDGVSYAGCQGDTLASALLANGVRLVGRSFKYHRPRGIYSAGPEEPNALVRLGKGDRAEPNTRATMVELFDGLTADSQNRWPSLKFDVMATTGLLSPFFPAGFYYKTFMWPPRLWMTYEKVIRRAAGLGISPDLPDPDRYERRSAHCDVLVVGGGPAGIAAALAAAETGARVMLVDERADFGGSLCRERRSIDGAPALTWVDAAMRGLAALPEVTILSRTTAFGYYDHNNIGLVERVIDHAPTPGGNLPRQRLWTVQAREVVLAQGAIERPLVFAGNDLPGVMLASAARAYVNQYAVKPGERAVVFTNNDDAYRTALDLSDAGATVAAVVDIRPGGGGPLASLVRAKGIEILTGQAVAAVKGKLAVTGVEIRPVGDLDRPGRRIACDLVASSGGWTPSVHLFSQSGGKLKFDEAVHAFVPGQGKQRLHSAGSTTGAFALDACISQGFAAGAAAAGAAGFTTGRRPAVPAIEPDIETPLVPLWEVPAAKGAHGKRFVDIQDDVTANDIGLAAREGYRSVEHLKRYTTLGMGTDQGKTSNMNGLALMAGLRGKSIPEVGTTTFRPPYTPIAFGTVTGRELGKHFQPVRRTPMHAWHERQGAAFTEAGLWLRPKYYVRPGETPAVAITRETLNVRQAVGLVDVSTLGKIDVQGPDAAEFLDRLCANTIGNLPVGKARYHLMLREDGIVADDGTTSRIGETQFYVTTTTAKAGAVMADMEYYLQVVWPELRVQVASITEQWAVMALAGPNSRAVLETVLSGFAAADLPHMGVCEGRVAGVPARVFRMSFSGELAYEIAVPADWGEAVWEAVLAAGAAQGIMPYGTEAMGIMRIEKGHVAGPELNGTTTAADLGLGRMVSKKKRFIGGRLLGRPCLADPNRQRLVGLVPVDGVTPLRGGAQLVADPYAPPPVALQGHVASVAVSPTLGHPIALAFLERGAERLGETLFAAFPLNDSAVEVRVVSPFFYDPEGTRLHG